MNQRARQQSEGQISTISDFEALLGKPVKSGSQFEELMAKPAKLVDRAPKCDEGIVPGAFTRVKFETVVVRGGSVCAICFSPRCPCPERIDDPNGEVEYRTFVTAG